MILYPADKNAAAEFVVPPRVHFLPSSHVHLPGAGRASEMYLGLRNDWKNAIHQILRKILHSEDEIFQLSQCIEFEMAEILHSAYW